MFKLNYNLVVKLLSIVILLFGITLYTYSGSLLNSFVSDTKPYLIGNQNITSLSSDNLSWMFTTVSRWNWHPLTWLSYAIDYWLYEGLDTRGFHLTNNVLHAVNSVLLFFVILIVLDLYIPSVSRKFPIKLDNNALAAGAVSAVFFSIHPQHVESVAWVAERKDVLCQLFILLTFIAYMHYVVSIGMRRYVWYGIVLIAYLLALMSKPMAVTLPLVLLLLDIYPVRRSVLLAPVHGAIKQDSFFWLILEKLPLLLLASVSIILTLMAQQSALSGFSDMPLQIRIFNAFDSVLLYIRKALMPVHLSPFYPHLFFSSSGIPGTTYFSILGFVLITFVTIYLWYIKRHAWLIGWLFYLVTLAPVIGIIQVGLQGAADRYAYLTTLPIYFFLAGGLYIIFRKAYGFKMLLVSGFVLLISVSLIVLTKRQVIIWQNPVTLWSHAVASYPDNGFAHGNLGSALFAYGDYIHAAGHFKRARDRGQLLVDYLPYYVISSLEIDDYKTSIELLASMLANSDIRTNYYIDEGCVQYDMGWSLVQMNMFRDAIDALNKIEQLSPYYPDAKKLLKYIDSNLTNDKRRTGKGSMPGYCRELGGYTVRKYT